VHRGTGQSGCCVPAGRQLQIDCGKRRVPIGEERVRVYLFVAILGYSRRVYVRAF
jgi:hypothetical protein